MRRSSSIGGRWSSKGDEMSKRYRWLLSKGIVLVDILLINIAFVASYWVRYELQWFRAVDPAYYAPLRVYVPFALGLTALLLVSYRLNGVYSSRRGASWFDEVYALINGTAIGIVVMVAITFFYHPRYYSRLLFIYTGVLVIVLLSFARLVRRGVWRWLRRKGIGVDRVLIVGAGEVGRAVMSSIMAQPGLGYQVVGFVDDDPAKGRKDLGRFKALGPIDNLPRLIREKDVDEVIITLPWMDYRKVVSIIRQCERDGVRPLIVPDLFQLSLSHVDVDDLGGVPVLSVREVSISGWNLALKRTLDLSIALVGSILLLPLFIAIAIAIKLDSPGPILFKQVRVGKGGRPFVLYKFRSMHQGAEEELSKLAELNEAEGPIFKIRNDPRLTRVGRFLRRTSLDELPQFYNVLRGEMSIVGPRPALPSEVERYQEWHKKRFKALPGMTGLWQVSGRSDLPFDEMCLLDIYYVESWSLLLDIKILFKTIPAVLLGRGAY